MMSAAAWTYGWFFGFHSFLLNVAAALGIVGPALLFSNFIVKALQEPREGVPASGRYSRPCTTFLGDIWCHRPGP